MMRRILAPFYRRYRRLRLLGAITRTFALVSLLALGTIWADRLAAFPARARMAIAVAFALVALGVAVARLVDIMLISHEHVALCLDERVDSPRHGLLSAWQLDSDVPASDLSAVEKALGNHHIGLAAALVRGLSPGEVFPGRLFRRQLRHLLIPTACALILTVWGGWSVVLRYLDPNGDHPPYSNLAFRVAPERPQVIYGEDVEVGVKIDGGQVEEVFLFTQDDAGVRQSPCFRSADNEFTQRIEKVTTPLRFWFAAERTRSKWHQLELILIPKIVSLKLTITPPDYTLEEPQSFVVGHQPVRALRGSKMELMVFSNRPLAGGRLQIQPLENRGDARTVQAERQSPHAVAFAWQVAESASLVVGVTDIEGNASRDNVSLYQEALADARPEVIFEEPGPIVLATPDSKVPFHIQAHDDYGLKDVRLFRSLKSFRETVRELPLEQPYAVDSGHSGTFDMSALGVRIGYDIEYFAEASDYNPRAAGTATSEVHRIKVVSEDDYLNARRMQARLEDFERRYTALAERLDALAEASEKLAEAMEDGRPDQLAQARQRFREQLHPAQRMIKMFADARPLYEVEKEWQEQLAPLGQKLERLSEGLEDGSLTARQLRESARRTQEQERREVERMRATAKRLTQAARVQRLQDEFLQIVKQQDLLRRRLSAHRNRPLSAEQRRAYAQEQKAVKERLERFAGELKRRKDELPADLAPLKQSAEKFLSALEGMKPQEDMDRCRQSCQEGRGAEAQVAAESAFEKLRSLLTVCDGGGPANGTRQCLAFQPSMMRLSLDQLMMSRMTSMAMSSAGVGPAGQGGYATSMATLENVELVGPPVLGGMSTGSRGRGGAGAAASQREVERERFEGPEQRTYQYRFDPNEPFPERYRDRLIEYFKRVTREEQEDET